MRHKALALALLPEIYEKGIYKKYARDIETYAWKFGGLGYSVVRKRLRIEKYVYDKPMLKDAIRTEGVHKVAMLASLATKENEWALVDKLKNMSKPAVQELSKELRLRQDEQNSENCDQERKIIRNWRQVLLSGMQSPSRKSPSPRTFCRKQKSQ